MNAAAIALLWLGIVIGVAFIATPVKFSASSLDLPTALDVGRVTFRLLSRVEWVLAALLVVVALLARERLPWSIAIPIAVVLIEAVWLLPALGARTDAVRAGLTVAPSRLHTIFIALKVAECVALGHVAWATARAALLVPVR